MTDLAPIRRAFARKILASVGVENTRLEDAYASVPREVFVGPGPWRLYGAAGYREVKDEPARLYDDVLVALAPERGINNGQPSGHAMWIDAADPRPGDHAVHIGAGTGYYTAILAEMVGPAGRVTAIEYDGGLAAIARANLQGYSNVTVIHGDGAAHAFDPADVIYVNAGVTRPAETWLEQLKQGGRLVLPLTARSAARSGTAGAMIRFERQAADFVARQVSAAAFIPCEGLQEATADEELAEAFRRGGVNRLTRLTRGEPRPHESVWLRWGEWKILCERAGA